MTHRLLILALAIPYVGCGDATQVLSTQAVHLALKSQPSGIAVDETFARDVDSFLARSAEALPVNLDCFDVSADFRFDRLLLAGVSEPAYAAWVREELETGDAEVDELGELYGFESVRYLSSFDQFSVSLSSPVRADRLASELTLLAWVGGASPVSVNGVASNIELMADDDAWEFSFWLGWGDCESGCINRHVWRAAVPVDEAVDAQLLEDSGPALPHPLAETCSKGD